MARMHNLRIFWFFIIFVCSYIDCANAQTSQCRLANAVSSNVAIGFPRLSDRAKSIGDLRITVIFVDFSDAPASQEPQQVFALISPTTENFVKQTSYSKLNIIFAPNYKWLRMSKSSASYNMKPGLSTYTQGVYMYEAATLALADGVDFSTSDQFLVLTNPAAKNVVIGPAFCSSPGFGVPVKGKEFINGVTSGADITSWSTFWYIHELGHTLGLPDLYAFTGPQLGYTGDWSIMGTINATAREFSAWERWLLGWISDTQVSCLSSSSSNVTLSENLSPVGVNTNALKIIVVKLSATKAMVAESRRSTTYDVLSKEGLLVYIVDTSIRTGSGPIQVLPIDTSDTSKMNSVLGVSESITYAGVKMKLVSRGTDLDNVEIFIPASASNFCSKTILSSRNILFTIIFLKLYI